jgi:hypothetical protein
LLTLSALGLTNCISLKTSLETSLPYSNSGINYFWEA